jgi:Flp pilus assembly protein TadG
VLALHATELIEGCTMLSCRRHNRQRGAAAVEFGLVLPLLALLVMGTLDWGYYLYVTHLVTNAAREGARAGTLTDPDDPAAEASASAERTARQYLEDCGLDGAPAIINAGLGPGGDAVQVTVDYPGGSVTGFVLDFVPDRIRASAVMRWF